MQHRAVLVCILCVLAVLLTFGITTTLLKKEEPAPSVSESVADPTPPRKAGARVYLLPGSRWAAAPPSPRSITTALPCICAGKVAAYFFWVERAVLSRCIPASCWPFRPKRSVAV